MIHHSSQISQTALRFAVLATVILGIPVLRSDSAAQVRDDGESLDARIDSLLLFDPEFYGTQIDTGALRHVSDPPVIGSVPGTVGGITDLALFRQGRTLPAYTRSEGFVLALGSGIPSTIIADQGVVVGVSGGGGYAFGIRRWQWRLGAQLDLFGSRRPLRVVIEGHDVVDTRETWKCGDVENSLAALLAGVDARHLYAQRNGVSGSLTVFPTPTIAVSVEGLSDLYGNAPRIAEWSVLGPPQPFAEVPNIVAGRLTSLTPRLAMGTYATGGGDGSGLKLGLDARVEFGSIDTMTFHQATIDGRVRWWPARGRLSIAGHARIVISEGSLPEQRRVWIGGFGTIPSQPLNAFLSSSSTYWAFELLVRPFADHSPPTLADLAVLTAAEVCTSQGRQGEQIPHGGVGVYVATATGKFRMGFAIPTDGPFDIRFAMRLTSPF